MINQVRHRNRDISAKVIAQTVSKMDTLALQRGAVHRNDGLVEAGLVDQDVGVVAAVDGHLHRERGDDVEVLRELEAQVRDHVVAAVDVVSQEPCLLL